MEKIILIPIPLEEFKELVSDVIEQKFHSISQSSKKERSSETDQFLTPSEASAFAKISKGTLRAWENKKIIAGHRIGRKVYYSQSDLLRAIMGKRDYNNPSK